MPRSSRWTDDAGSAALEFILAGVVLLVPLVYLVVALGQIQGQTMGVDAAARHVARAVATASDETEAAERVDLIVASVVDGYGLDADAVEVALTCRPAGECPRAGATLVVTVSTQVALPLVPEALGLSDLASVAVESASAQKISRLWGSR
ncbi:TadE family protein [Microbacterium fluvii]|uniref:TadE family protein n=1 Tax=Microbacterium fluvii TaxID=415215 RepID=A0ABW2HBY2_9MICO|nr:TadE family protein [Microbacterium fluvii]MCU4672189.1 TadE family protein [Microbacterium fluvii]